MPSVALDVQAAHDGLKLDVQRGKTAADLKPEELRSIALHAFPTAMVNQAASDRDVLELCSQAVREMTVKFMVTREGWSGYRMSTQSRLPQTAEFRRIDHADWTKALGFDLFEQEVDGQKLNPKDPVFKRLSMMARSDGAISFFMGPSEITSRSDRREYVHLANGVASDQMKSMALLGKVLADKVVQDKLQLDSCVGFSWGGAQLQIMAMAANVRLPDDKKVSMLSIDAPLLNEGLIKHADPEGKVSGLPRGLNFAFVTDESDENLHNKMSRLSGKPLDEHIGGVLATAATWIVGLKPTVAAFHSPGTFTVQIPVDKQVLAAKAKVTDRGTTFSIQSTPAFSAGVFGNHPRGQQLPQALWAVLNYFTPPDQHLALNESGVVELREGARPKPEEPMRPNSPSAATAPDEESEPSPRLPGGFPAT